MTKTDQAKDEIVFRPKEIITIFVTLILVTFFIFALGVFIGKEYTEIQMSRTTDEKR